MAYAGPEYWYVIYKAIADFGDLRRDAAEARKELQSMADAAKALSAAEVAASTKADQVRQTEIRSLQAENQALQMLGSTAKQTNQQLLYGGRTDMQQHLSDMDRLLQYQTLLNRATWLNFSTPQQAMSFRQMMYQQKLLENKAEFAGYLTADQYLSYMARRTMAANLDSASIKARALAVAEETQAMLGYANALQGSHQSIGQLGAGVTAVGRLGDAISALPDTTVTKLVLDDASFRAGLLTDEAMLAALPDREKVRVGVLQPGERPALLSGNTALGPLPRTRAGGAGDEDAAARELAEEMQRLAASTAAAERVIGRAMGEDFRGGSRYIPPGELPRSTSKDMVVKAEFDDVAARAGLQMWVHELLAAVQRKYEFHAGLDDAQALTELDNLMARFRAGETEALRLAAGMGGAAGGGGGGGPPPGAPPGGGSGGDFNGDADAAARLREEMIRLAAAEDGAQAAAGAVRAGVAGADAVIKDTARDIPPMVDGLVKSYGGWFGLNSQLRLFGGLMPGVLGQVAAWHVLVDFIIEGLAVFVPALVTLAADLIAFGVAGYDAGKQVYDRLAAIHTASDALQQTLAPMTGQLEKLHNTVRPMVWQLYGDAIDIAHSKTGLFNQLAILTGTTLDRLAAHVTVFATSASKGLETFFRIGNADLAKLGTFFDNLGKALLALIKITQETHVDQLFLNFFVVLSQLLVLITKLPTPILAAAVGLHAFWIWGGLAATVIMQMLGPVRALAIAMGGLAASETALGGLGKDASAFGRLRAGLTDIGAGLGAIPGRLNIFSKAAGDAGAAAGGLAEGELAMEAAGAGAATQTGFLSGLVTKLGGAAGLATVGLGILAAAAGVFAYMSLTAKNGAQQWINTLNQGLAKGSLFTEIGRTVQGLAADTDMLAHSQGMSAQAVHALAGEQDQLSGRLQNELVHVGQVSKAYGTDMPGALALLNAAGVKTSDLFTSQNKVWEQAMQQVRGLVDGYKAMGQGMSEIQRDVSVQLVMGSDQLKSMQKLNQAWDQFQQLTAGPFSGIVKVGGDLLGFAKDAAQAGASMVGLSSNSLALQKDFQGTYTDVETLFSAIRSADAVTGDAGFSGSVKHAVQALIPLAGSNKAAAAEISQLAQEAGGPATTNLAALARWAGNTHDPLKALYQDSLNATVGASNLDQDAARLSATLQSDLNPALANAAFTALGGQHALNLFATDLAKLGPDSTTTISAGRQVAQMFLSIDKNSASAKAQFVGWAESMGLSRDKASKLWAEVSKGQGPLESTRKGLEGSAGASDKLAKSGFFAQRGDTFRQNMREMGDFFGHTLPDFFTQTIPNAAKPLLTLFSKTIPNAAKGVAGFFSGSFASAVQGAWSHVWSGMVSPVVHLFDSIKTAVTTGFDGWWKTHGSALQAIWGSTVKDLKVVWDTGSSFVVGSAKKFWDTLSGVFRSGSSGVNGITSRMWKDIQLVAQGFWGLFGPLIKAGWDIVVGVFRVAVSVIEAVVKIGWDSIASAAKIAWAAIKAFLKITWDTIVAVFSVALDLLTGHWHQAWTDIKNYGVQVLNALKGFFAASWNAIKTDTLQAWNAIKSGVTGIWGSIENAAKGVWNNLKSGFNNVVSSIKVTWSTLEGIFKKPVSFLVNTVYDNGIARLWNDVMGAIGGPKLPVIKFGGGGRLPGYGGGDTVPAWIRGAGPALLEPGEAVVDKERTRKYAHVLRAMGVPGFQGGGIPGGPQAIHLGTTATPTGGNPLAGLGHDIVNFAKGAINVGKIVSALLTGNTAALGNALGAFIGPGGASGELATMITGIPKTIIKQLLSEAKHAATTAFGLGGPGGSATAGVQTVARYVMAHGGTREAGAGVGGTVAGESGGNPEAVQAGGGGGTGLIQWTPGSSAFPIQPLITGNVGRDMAVQLVDMMAYIASRGGIGAINAAGASGGPMGAAREFSMMEAPLVPGSDIRPSVVAQLYAQGLQSGGLVGMASGGLVEVPYLAGFHAGQAHNILAAAGLRPTAAKGQKASWWTTGSSPRATTHVAPHSAVSIHASASSRASGIRVPYLAGYTAGTAHNILVAEGLVPTAARGQKATWIVTGSRPAGGSGASHGMHVEIIAPKPITPGPPGGTPKGMDAAQAWSFYSSMLAHLGSAEDAAFSGLYGIKLPKAATAGQRANWARDRKEMYAVQRRMGLDRNALVRNLGNPSALTTGQWSKLISEAGTVKAWESGKNHPNWNWPAWHYAHPAWQKANQATASLQSGLGNAYGAWKSLYGPGGSLGPAKPLYNTPGILVTPSGGSPAPVNLASLIMGGPGSPVVSTGPSASSTGSGFAMGGLVGGDGASLGQVASMFSLGGMVDSPALSALGLPPAAQRQLAGASAGGMPRSLSEAAGDRIGVKVGNLTIHNPVAEKPSDTISRSTNRLAFLAGRGPV